MCYRIRIEFLNTSCVVAFQFLGLCCRIRIKFLNMSCVVAFQFLRLCCRIRIKFLNTSCVVAFQFLRLCCRIRIKFLNTSRVVALRFLGRCCGIAFLLSLSWGFELPLGRSSFILLLLIQKLLSLFLTLSIVSELQLLFGDRILPS